MAEEYCKECKAYTPLVYDRKAGDTICSECGIVLESYAIDEGAEWRTFADCSHKDEKVRVSRSDPLATNGGLGTNVFIGNSNGSPSGTSLNRWSNNVVNSKSNSHLFSGFGTINVMADNLGLVETIKNYAKELYKKAVDEKVCAKFRNEKAIMAACLYLACQEEGLPRTFKEISSVPNGAKMKEIRKAMEVLKKQLEVGSKTIYAKDIARRYCYNLGLSHHTVKAVQEAVQKSEEYDIRRNSTSILAAAIYMVTQLSGNQMSLKEIAQAFEVTEVTVRKAYKDLYPHASVLIPCWYAAAEDREKLFVP